MIRSSGRWGYANKIVMMIEMTYILQYTAVFVLMLLAELLYFKLAVKYSIIDKPHHQSSHTGRRGDQGRRYRILPCFPAVVGCQRISFCLGTVRINGAGNCQFYR